MNKSKFNSGILATAIIALILFMTFSCAQIGSISGGDKDTTAPAIRKSRPEIYSSNFHGRKVKIKFDEFYSLDKVETTFLMTPPQDSIKPKIKTKGKWLIVKFKEDLKDDTTYTLQFFNSVKDFNEGNILKDFQFVFSTGDVVDSCAVSGQVFDAESLKREEGILVGLYGENSEFADSAFIKYKPDYITRTDTAGRFKLVNIRPGRYRIMALKDINETQRFDLENEKVAFLKTILETKAESVRKVDSLKAGTVIHMGTKGHRYLDTLLQDTVIVQELIYTTPNNISLFSFEEKHLVQYLQEKKRDIRNRVNLVFNKPVDDSVVITYVDDTLKSPEIIYDYNYFRDSLTVWFKDTADINNDTLELRVSFSTLDSLLQPTIETDTISVKFSNKKKVEKKDDKKKKTAEDGSGIDSLNFKIKTNFSGDFDIAKSINIQVPIVCSNIDTSLIKLYECVDSTFEEDMNQKMLKAVRLDSANYRLVFKRPILGDIIWYPNDSIVDPNWFTATYSANRDTVDIEVTDSAMIHKSKFSNMLKYHNEYYMGQVQKIRDSIPTVIINQKIIKYSRPSRDTISIVLEKTPAREFNVSPINIDKMPEDGIEVVVNKDRITLLLKDSLPIKKDTLALKINTFDRMVHNRNMKVVEKTFKDTIFAIYKIPFQKLKEKKLIGDDTLRFVFDKKLKQTPVLQLCDYPEKGSTWYTSTISDTKDTMLVVSNDEDFRNLDTIKYSIQYWTLDKKENEKLATDTLTIVRPKKEVAVKGKGGNRRKSDVGMESTKKKEESKKNMAKGQLLFPLEYTMTVDSMNSKNRVISYDFEPGKSYMLEIDDSTFTSIYDTPNLYSMSKGKIRQLDYYGQLNIKLENLGNVELYPDIDEDIPPFEEIDTSRTLRKRINPKDTIAVQDSTIATGQILVCLCNDKGAIKYQKVVKNDGVVEFNYILPGDYRIRIIHDRNSNNKWDTGKYIENIYPERTVEFPKKQTVKSKWVTEVVWRL